LKKSMSKTSNLLDAKPPIPADGDELNEKAAAAGFGAPNADVVAPNADVVGAPNSPPAAGAAAPNGEAVVAAPKGLAVAAGCWPNNDGADATEGAPKIEPV